MYRAEAVTITARGRAIVDAVDLVLPPGQVTVLIGPNGAGKSTLLKAMAGGRRLDAGRVTLHGRDVGAWRPAPLAAMRSVLSQSVHVAFAFRVDEVVRLGLPPGIARARADAVVARALDRVGLGGFAARDCTTLSGGEQQRVHLARTLVQLHGEAGDRARYLLLDEPTNGLDLAHQLLVVRIAREHAAAGGGVLAVLHDLNLAAVAADRIVALDRGRIVADGTPEAVITDGLLKATYGVDLKVNAVPRTVFVLPESAAVRV